MCCHQLIITDVYFKLTQSDMVKICTLYIDCLFNNFISPILFNIYLDDLSIALNSSVIVGT